MDVWVLCRLSVARAVLDDGDDDVADDAVAVVVFVGALSSPRFDSLPHAHAMPTSRRVPPQSPGTALDMATLAANPGPGSEPLRLWLKLLSALQYMDTVGM